MNNILEKLVRTNLFDTESQYLKLYVKLIISNLNQEKIKFKTQEHHIIPKSYYKDNCLEVDNSKDNLVNLLYKDHILAHYYLALASTDKLFRYQNTMAIQHVFGNKHVNCEEINISTLNLDLYQSLYEEAMQHQKDNAYYTHKGRKRTQETIENLRKANKGRIYVNNGKVTRMIKPNELDSFLSNGYVLGRNYSPSEETKEKMRKSSVGHTVSDETKEKIRKKRANQEMGIWVSDDTHSIKIKKSEESEYLSNGWIRGRKPWKSNNT